MALLFKTTTLLKQAGVPTIFLDATVEELWRRCCTQAQEAGAERPLLASPEQFRKLYQNRRRRYGRAWLTISTSRRTVDEIAAEITQTLALKQMAIRVEQGEVE